MLEIDGENACGTQPNPFVCQCLLRLLYRLAHVLERRQLHAVLQPLADGLKVGTGFDVELRSRHPLNLIFEPDTA